MLTEKRRDMLALWRKTGIERRRDQHFDHRLRRPAVEGGVGVGSMHIVHARRHDDSGRQMISASRKRGEVRQLVDRHVHAESGAFASPMGKMILDLPGDCAPWD